MQLQPGSRTCRCGIIVSTANVAHGLGASQSTSNCCPTAGRLPRPALWSADNRRHPTRSANKVHLDTFALLQRTLTLAANLTSSRYDADARNRPLDPGGEQSSFALSSWAAASCRCLEQLPAVHVVLGQLDWNLHYRPDYQLGNRYQQCASYAA